MHGKVKVDEIAKVMIEANGRIQLGDNHWCREVDIAGIRIFSDGLVRGLKITQLGSPRLQGTDVVGVASEEAFVESAVPPDTPLKYLLEKYK